MPPRSTLIGAVARKYASRALALALPLCLASAMLWVLSARDAGDAASSPTSQSARPNSSVLRPWTAANEAALKALKQKAERGDLEAQFTLGSMYHTGVAVPLQDDYEAVKWLRKASEHGHERAQYVLGTIGACQ